MPTIVPGDGQPAAVRGGRQLPHRVITFQEPTLEFPSRIAIEGANAAGFVLPRLLFRARQGPCIGHKNHFTVGREKDGRHFRAAGDFTEELAAGGIVNRDGGSRDLVLFEGGDGGGEAAIGRNGDASLDGRGVDQLTNDAAGERVVDKQPRSEGGQSHFGVAGNDHGPKAQIALVGALEVDRLGKMNPQVPDAHDVLPGGVPIE